ncbi:glycosyltransferase [uncultured Eubacterium sp.]|uniref:glycosyltransferase n=1 Tax=uncultured Eubacterium sp. TaxID=165185 RepID=UPI0025EAF559|nr:glycosyltransferase [uncultured Eubacterium sp.]
MKTILFINGHLNTGGCERSLVDLLNNIDYEEYCVDLLLLEGRGEYFNELNSNINVYYYPLNNAFGSFAKVIINSIKNKDWFSLRFRLIYLFATKFGKKNLKFCKSLFKNLRKKYDVIIAYRPGICTELAGYCFDSNFKMSWWHHGEFNYDKKKANTLFESYMKMDKVAVVSKPCLEMLKDVNPLISDKYILIQNMVCVDEIIEKSIKENVSKHNCFSIISVGRLSYEKNMILCPMIAKELKKMNVDFSWTIIGDGDEKQNIAKYIDDNQLQRCVKLIGSKSNPYPYIFNSDLFVHPSKVESQGIAILEAMALNVPVVVAKSIGPMDFINADNGILTECSVESMTKEIIKLIKDKEKYARLKLNTVLPEQFLPQNVMKRFYDTIGKCYEY